MTGLKRATGDPPDEGMHCTCAGRICSDPMDRWTCDGCKRQVPLCNGADDEAPGLCDQCWDERHSVTLDQGKERSE